MQISEMLPSHSPGLEGLQSSSACEVHVTLSCGMFPTLHQSCLLDPLFIYRNFAEGAAFVSSVAYQASCVSQPAIHTVTLLVRCSSRSGDSTRVLLTPRVLLE